MPKDNSYRNEDATGLCSNCGSVVSFPANDMTAKCPRCGCNEHRSTTGAVSASMQRAGYRMGDGVVPRTRY